MNQIDKCIRCGFCLESCPTFQLTGDETESPRGRIYLVKNLLDGQVNATDISHSINHCLGCLACETACPSGVEYSSILELARERIDKSESKINKRRFLKSLLLSTITRPKRNQIATRFSFLGNRLLRFLSSKSLMAKVPTPETLIKLKEDYPTPSRRVYFLEGCSMSTLYKDTNESTIRLLRRHGCDVILIPSSYCCGSLHFHNGKKVTALQLANSLTHFVKENIPIITNSAGCGSTLKAYRKHPEILNGERISLTTVDICEFLHEIGFKPKPKNPVKVTYHDACHLAHGQRIKSSPRELIKSVPGVELIELQDSDTCCGSAGIYNFLEPDFANQLIEKKWKNIVQTGAEIVLTGNPGCLAWINQIASEKGSSIKVMHTAKFLADD